MERPTSSFSEYSLHAITFQIMSLRPLSNPDVVLIGSGIMSANLGALLKTLDSNLSIQLFEVTDEFAKEASNGWNNAGTGHAGICELSYTPDQAADGTVDVSNAIKIFEQFESSRQFWAYAVEKGMISNPRDCINPVAHMSFVHGDQQVEFLRQRHKGMANHHFFETMTYSTDRGEIASWAPLLLDERDPNVPIAATRMEEGTDVNFGSIALSLVNWLDEQDDCCALTGHKVVGLEKTKRGWDVLVENLATEELTVTSAKFVFVGAGGGSLQLLQKAGIPQAQGLGGFPIGGQWLICKNPEVIAKHQAKVYGQALEAAPTMAVPHLDTRILDGEKSLLFGPFASWTTKFLHGKGSFFDLPGTVKPHNLATLLKVGISNLPLVKYLVQQGTQSMQDRMDVLHVFYPGAKAEDWKLIDAGIRVQAIKKEDGEAGIVHYGTEVITSDDCSISALLGASPGASVSVHIVLEVIKKCLPEMLETEEGKRKILEMIPNFNEDLKDPSKADRYRELAQSAIQRLGLIYKS